MPQCVLIMHDVALLVQGVKTARLPIQQHVQLKAATVLTVNQVTDILLKQVRGDGDA